MWRTPFEFIREKAASCSMTGQVSNEKNEEIHTYNMRIIKEEETGKIANSNADHDSWSMLP